MKKTPPKTPEGATNFVSLFESMEKGQALFNQLKRKCHPDLFLEEEKKVKAEELFKLVMKHSTDYEALLGLQKRIETELQ